METPLYAADIAAEEIAKIRARESAEDEADRRAWIAKVAVDYMNVHREEN